MTEPVAIACSLDQAGDVGNDVFIPAVELDNTEVGLQGREGIIGDLRLCCRNHRDQGALTGVREADQRDIGHELENQSIPDLLTLLTLFGERGCPLLVREESGIAFASDSGRSSQPSITMSSEVDERFMRLVIEDHGADGHLHDQILCATAVLLLSRAMGSVACDPVRVVTKGE